MFTSRNLGFAACVAIGLCPLTQIWADQPPAAKPASHSRNSTTNIHEWRQQWLFDQRAFPLGYIPDGARASALQQITQSKSRPLLRDPVKTDGQQWVNIGPAPIVNGQI